MMAKEQYYQEAGKPVAMHAKKFALWLFLVSVIMVFAALTSYMMVVRAEGNWREVALPGYFWITTAVILLSSATMHWAYTAAKKDNFPQLKLAIGITSVLGVIFLVGQFMAYGELISRGVFFAGKQSHVAGSILYVLSGLHGLHLVGGIVFLLVVLVNSLNFKIHSKSLDQIQMCATYWHFLDLLWVYLFVFLLLNP